MSTPACSLRLLIGALCASLVPWSLVHADRTFEQRRAADPHGSVEIVELAGAIEVIGWDKAEVEVSATGGDEAQHVEVITSGSRTSIHVDATPWKGVSADDTHLIVHVPAQSAVSVSLVTAKLRISGVQGDANLHSVSGNLSGDVGGNLRANSVGGNIQMSARAAKTLEVKTINGNIDVTGGSGETEVATISGRAQVTLGTVQRARFKSISGDLSVSLTLAPQAEVQGESVTGNVQLTFNGTPAADFDLQSFSGAIDNCFGPKPTEAHYGPGSRLAFTSGSGGARVRIETKAGNVSMCDGSGHRQPVAMRGTSRWPEVLYMI